MKKVLYIATMGKKRNRLDGETIKCRVLQDYLSKIENIKLNSIDTDNWKANIIILVLKVIYYYLFSDIIIISAADRGSNILLNFLYKIRNKKKVYYFVIGGALSKNIVDKRWNTGIYKNIDNIYVESNILKNDLEKLGIKNLYKLNNFRNISFNSDIIEDPNFEEKEKKKLKEKVELVFFGRVIKDKGVEEAIKLVKKLNCEFKENNIEKIITLDIIGQAKEEYRENIEELIDNDTNIKFLGAIIPNNIDEYKTLEKYDLFILPTEYKGECLPGALVDAYISGLGVIVSNWKYAKEYVQDGENGIIFEYKNYDDMYKKVKKLKLDEEKIINYKKNSYNLRKEYDIEYVLKEFKEELEKDK